MFVCLKVFILIVSMYPDYLLHYISEILSVLFYLIIKLALKKLIGRKMNVLERKN